ncbi:hypothetical protein [Paenibacillus aceti]|uniref:Uncharacterized protein n=1 Tax=Paenibacillus aceti TaxID=1820010 RepID=A0ABQ1VZV7_9BACL|nr:hypothetical protein [Paenibacillus aceti]GGG07876.1 hypothetical protein GCM10010913_32090 [Paenibacillus aceti]
MLNDKQYLWLCELADSGLLQAQQHSGSVLEVVRGLQPALTARELDDLAEAILGSASYADFELQAQSSGDERLVNWVLLLNKEQQQGVIVVGSEPGKSAVSEIPSLPLDSVVDGAAHSIQEQLPAEAVVVFTGLGQCGWYAALLAERLDAEAVVFGAPTMEELPGRAINYVGEDTPVGEYTEKVVFVKEIDELGTEADTIPLFRKLAFDDGGRLVVSEQSEFSRFVSWFYNTVGTVEPAIWNLFFPGMEEEEAVILADLGVYSVFLKVGELTQEKLLRSINDTVRYAAGKLESQRGQLAAQLDKLPDEDYDDRVVEVAEKYTKEAAEFIGHTFDSVQTVLMGVALFTLERADGGFDTESLIDSFQIQLHELLDQEVERVKDTLDQAVARRLEQAFQLPAFELE